MQENISINLSDIMAVIGLITTEFESLSKASYANNFKFELIKGQIEAKKSAAVATDCATLSVFKESAAAEKIDSNLLAILENFNNKNIYIVMHWLQAIINAANNLQKNELQCAILTINDENLQAISLPNDKLIYLKINIENFKTENFEFLLQKLNDVPILYIGLEGKSPLTSQELTHFLEKLYKVEFISIKEAKLASEMQKSLDEIFYRNHFIKQFDIKFKIDPWSLIIEKWLKLHDYYWKSKNTTENRIYYCKPFANADHKFYIEHWQNFSKSEKLENSLSLWQYLPKDHKRFHVLNASIIGMGDLFFAKMLENLNKHLQLDHFSAANYDLALNFAMTNQQLAMLTQYILKNKNTLPFAKLSICVNANLIIQPEFLALIEALKGSGIQSLQWEIDWSKLKAIKLILDNKEFFAKIINKIDYPILFRSSVNLDYERLNKTDFQSFEGKIIAAIQAANNEKSLGVQAPNLNRSEAGVQYSLEQVTELYQRHKNEKLITNEPLMEENYDEFINIEVQHIETVEQQEEINEEINQNVEANFETQHEYQIYEDKLIDYQSFLDPKTLEYFIRDARKAETQIYLNSTDYDGEKPYLALIKNELFGNLPNAIKYFTPEAAVIVAKNLPVLAALNADNLPQNFILKKTKNGEIVLDYDPYAEERKVNIFTPKSHNRHQKYDDVIYEVDLYIHRIKTLAGAIDEDIFNDIVKNKKLTNLWIRYGDQGIKLFFSKFNQLAKVDALLPYNFYYYYLRYFKQWDHFLDDGRFVEKLDKIVTYEPLKLSCFQNIFMSAAPLLHDISDTVDAFEIFWEKLDLMCYKHKADINKIKYAWEAPKGGNPVVYMERLLTILENARNLDEQLDCLKGIKLTSYGAYYASKYEGFKIVSPRMEFNYDPNEQNEISFDPNRRLYKVELEELYQLIFSPVQSKKTSEQAINSKLYRFIGEQINSIKIESFAAAFKKFAENQGGYKTDNKVIFIALLFLTHERYKNETPDIPFFSHIFRLVTGDDAHISIIKELVELYKQGIKLNYPEGKVLCEKLCLMNSYEYESQPGANKKSAIKKLFNNLRKNKYAVFKFLEAVKNGRRPMNYALDTHDYLAEDPNVAIFYRDDLLLFSALINQDKEVYYDGIKDNKAVTEKLDKVKEYLAANSKEANNNFDYALRLILQAKSHFSYDDFLHLCEEIYPLSKFDKQAVDESLRKHHFTVYDTFLPDFFKQDNIDLKIVMIDFILNLKRLKASDVNIADKLKLLFLSNTPEDVNELKLTAYSEKEALLKEMQEQVDTNADSIAAIKNLEIELKQLKEEVEQEKQIFIAWKKDFEELNKLDVKDLQAQLKTLWKEAGHLLPLVAKPMLKFKIASIRKYLISSILEEISNADFKGALLEKIPQLKDFANCDNFEDLDKVTEKVQNIVKNCNELIARKNFKDYASELISIFKKVDFVKLNSDNLQSILVQLLAMPQRNYTGILAALFASAQTIINNNKNISPLLTSIAKMNVGQLPSAYIERLIKLFPCANNADKLASYTSLVTDIIAIFAHEKENELLKFMMRDPNLELDQIISIVTFTKEIESNNIALIKLFTHLISAKQAHQFLTEIDRCNISEQSKKLLLQIIASSYACTPNKSLLGKNTIDFIELVKKIAKIGDENINALHVFYTKYTASIFCVNNALDNYKEQESFNVFFATLEKSPYGQRNLAEQFNISQVERTINNSKDLQNQSRLPYQYRKQMMEAFLFVNRAGLDLPVYYGKAAKDLSNAEISDLFNKIKKGEINFQDSFKNCLYALGLLREAMYRTTGQFPYSTQVISIIDCMMHTGDVISNIDTGQGKSLIDVMKAALLWLVSDHVAVTTSSLTDAKRDIENYSSFFSLLNIPYSKKPITPNLPADISQIKGISFSTLSQISLFFSKLKLNGINPENEINKVSWIPNESDDAILDDRTIYRYASSDGTGPGFGNEWVYYAINEFVNLPNFNAKKKPTLNDVNLLKAHLARYAKIREKSFKIINKFTDEKLLIWIHSAISVNYKLREKFHYVILPKPKLKQINGEKRMTRVVKILQKYNKRKNLKAIYGAGVQQLLYAKLNAIAKKEEFIIEPESKPIISSYQGNTIDYYRSKPGFIWGSSATVGSDREIEEQYSKFGFAFSKIEPHQRKIVKTHKVRFLKDQNQHFKAIMSQLIQKKQVPKLVFFKDIETAEAFFKSFQEKYGNKYPIQLYTDLEDELEAITKAAKPGMLTITTSALGRNTDILYDRTLGMDVYQTFVNSTRGEEQRAGRTGRQGSKGNEYYLLNKEDLKGKTIEQIKELTDAEAAREREFNRELYDVLGYLVTHLPDTISADAKSKFLKKEWAEFSSNVEENYRKMKGSNSYQFEKFVRDTMDMFNRLPLDFIEQEEERKPSVQAIIQAHSTGNAAKEKYQPYQCQVLISDCIPPEIIAGSFVTKNEKKSDIADLKEVETDKQPENANEIKETVKTRLDAIFNLIKQGNFGASNKDYINYMSANTSSLQIIRAAHNEFLQEFLDVQVESFKNRSFLKRWFGVTSPLAKIANDRNYLWMFKALTNVAGENKLNLTTLQESVNTLLDNYLQNSWFISGSRKEEANRLKNAISEAKDIHAIFVALTYSKTKVIKSDIEANQKIFSRKIKPIGLFGKSRFQETIDSAIVLTSVTTGESFTSSTIDQLVDKLKSLITDEAAKQKLDAFKREKTLDNFIAINKLKTSDNGSARVLIKSIFNALEDDLLSSNPKGMQGRTPLKKR